MAHHHHRLARHDCRTDYGRTAHPDAARHCTSMDHLGRRNFGRPDLAIHLICTVTLAWHTGSWLRPHRMEAAGANKLVPHHRMECARCTRYLDRWVVDESVKLDKSYAVHTKNLRKANIK